MKNLFKYAASYWKAMIAIMLILFVQAYCDLSLPAYTSNIVNVGIQQGGIEDEIPEQIAREEMDKLLLFVSEEVHAPFASLCVKAAAATHSRAARRLGR